MNVHKTTAGRIQVACVALAGLALAAVLAHHAQAGDWWPWRHHQPRGPEGYRIYSAEDCDDVGGSWYWMRSPEQEQRVVASLYKLHCRRCHGLDGRGVWDVPDVPDLTNERWQATRTEGQFARAILEGRGAVMPAFRGTLTLEEAWAMARYMKTFIPGREVSRPDVRGGEAEKEKEKTSKPQP